LKFAIAPRSQRGVSGEKSISIGERAARAWALLAEHGVETDSECEHSIIDI